MAWYSDEAWDMISDSINKKNVARSARSTRTHCGKSGAVKFPSDFMSRKELKAMNGEVESYRMNAPMSWDEFVKMPIDLQRTYINHLREKFNAPDQYIAEMFGKSHSFFIDHLFRLKMSADKWMEGNTWDREGFMAWRLGIDVGETEPVPVEENKEDETMDILDRPMTFKEFKALTDEQKKEYIERLRKMFDVPNTEIAKMLGCSAASIANYIRKLNVGYGRPNGSHRPWNEDGWNKWLQGAYLEAVEEPEVVDETPNLTDAEKGKVDYFVQDLQGLSAEVIAGMSEQKVPTIHDFEPEHIDTARPIPIIPMSGTMTFQGDVDDILTTLKTLLSGTRNKLTVSWEPID